MVLYLGLFVECLRIFLEEIFYSVNADSICLLVTFCEVTAFPKRREGKAKKTFSIPPTVIHVFYCQDLRKL